MAEIQDRIIRLEDTIDQLKKTIDLSEAKKKEAEDRAADAEDRLMRLEEKFGALQKFIDQGFLLGVKEFKLGEGDTSIKMDRRGLWVGKNTFEEAIGDTGIPADGPDGTAIAIDGTVYAKDGYSGADAFLIDTLGTTKTITVQNGIITDIS